MNFVMLRRIGRDALLALSSRQKARAVERAGLWFVDIPRTGSSSIRAELGMKFGPAFAKKNLIESEFSGEQLFPDHVPAVEVRAILGLRTWSRIYKFSFVRNPYDRIFSLFYFLRKRNLIPLTWSFAEFVKRQAAADQDTPYFHFHGLRRGQSEYLFDEQNVLLVDDVFRFEEREGAVKKIGEKIGFLELGGLHLQGASPNNQRYTEFYDNDLRRVVAQRYASDFELLGYEY
jgi:hypothetical protein